MSSLFGSLFGGGRWEWDEERRGIVFVSTVKTTKKKKTEKETSQGDKGASRRANLELRFVDALDPKEMATFRHVFMRHVRDPELDVITLQEVRDAALFQCTTPLPLDLIDLLHTESVDRFMRALIVYMQQFLKVVELLRRRHEVRAHKLTVGSLTPVELGWQRDLCDLRTVVAREHCALLLATGDGMERYHHLEGGRGGTTTSQGERDIRCFEMLWRITARCVYIALERPSATVIESEMNRLFRSSVFSRFGQNRWQMPLHKGTKTPDTPASGGSGSHVPSSWSEYERRILFGPSEDEYNKFRTRSPAVLTALACEDYRLMGIGQIDFGSNDERLELIREALMLPEELLASHNIVIGILGRHRDSFDPMLVPLQKINEKASEDAMGSLSTYDLDNKGKEEEEALPMGLELPPPGIDLPPPPARFPQARTTLPAQIAALQRRHKELREQARKRWRRWIISGARRHAHRKLSDVEDDDNARHVARSIVTEVAEEATRGAAGRALDEALAQATYTPGEHAAYTIARTAIDQATLPQDVAERGVSAAIAAAAAEAEMSQALAKMVFGYGVVDAVAETSKTQKKRLTF